MRATALILSIAACSGFVFKTPSAVKPLRAEATESEAPAEAEAPAAAAPAEEPAAPAPATSSASFNPDKVFKVDESPLMAYISRSWNKLDGSDTVEVEEMLKDPATVATINQPDELGANALTLAASLNVPKPEIIKALLKAGADVNAKLGEEWSEKDTSALYRAVEGESLCGINQCVGCTSPFSATTRPCWLHRVVRDPHRHAVELASRRWREDHDSAVAETRRDNLSSTQANPWSASN